MAKVDTLLYRYIPHSGDPTDEALSSFINTHPEGEKMKIMFLRESEGVYTFGQRKVHIDVKRGNQIFVRVGGGHLRVQDFIAEYTQLEQDKNAERTNALSRF